MSADPVAGPWEGVPARDDEGLVRRPHGAAMIEVALHYAAKGWKVFPLRPNTKVPATDNGFKAATTLPKIINDWWTRWPDANVGIVTGADSGIVVLDVDRKHGVDGVVASSELDLPETLVVKTPTGGFHLFFTLPKGVTVPRRIGVKPGLDILGDGGYVVAAGSTIDGAAYEIVRNREMAPCPDVLVKLAAHHKAASVTPIAGKVAAGGRNHYLTQQAGKMRRIGSDETEIAAALQAINLKRCNPPLPYAEVAGIAESVCRYPSAGLQPEITDSDMANAQRLACQSGENIRFTTELGWLIWDGSRFAQDSKGVLVQALAKQTARRIFDEIKDATDRDAMMRHAKKSQSKNAIDSMIYLARSEPDIFANTGDFDADPMLLNVLNGTIDLRTGTLRPHARSDRLTKLTGIAFDPHADCELFDQFLTRITGGSDALYSYLQRLVGYLLTGLTTEQVIVFLYGLGANGKTVFSEIVLALLGEYVMVAEPELVMSRRHGGISNDVAALRGRRVALMNETTQGSRFDEAKLKQLTGGDTLTGRFLYQEAFDFAPTHKLMIRGNHKPAINGTDEGIWRRLHLVPFAVQIPAADQDRHLLDKLKAELPGILRWAVEGCLAWQRDGLNPPSIVLSAVQDYRQESDILGRFIEERCEKHKLHEIKSSAFYSAYKTYCDHAAERCLPSKDLPGEMERRGFKYDRKNYGRMYLGIRLQPNESANGDAW